MWGHFLKTALRALMADRFFTFVNLTGLSVGLAAVSFIFLHVSHEVGHDAWLPGHETLYRVDTAETHPGRAPLDIALAPGPMRDALLKEFPQIAGVARAYRTPANVVRDGAPFREELLVADADFFSLVRLPLALGTPERALAGTGSVALSARAAEKYFGSANAIGRRLTIRAPEPRDYVVSAVFETLPDNSHMAFDVVIPFEAYFGANSEEIRAIPTSWGGAYFFTYARLKPGARPADIEARLPAFIDRNLPSWMTDVLKVPPHEFYRFRFVPVRDVHFEGGELGAMKPRGSRTGLVALSGVAILILVIAAINFANLTTARSTLRAKEVALRKVVGASRRQIFAQFLGEAVLTAAIAGILGLAIVELTLPYVTAGLGLAASSPLANAAQLWGGLIFIVLVTAILSGLYPSVIVSRIRPAVVFNREHARQSGGRVRGALVVGQFAISIGLIAVTIVMGLQMRFTRELDLGFDKENLLIVRMPDGAERDALARSFADAVARLPGAIDVALSSAVPSDPSEDNISVRAPSQATPIQIGFHRVDSNFFRTYGVQPLAGRADPVREEAGAGERRLAAVVNLQALKRLGFATPAEAIGQAVRTSGTEYAIVGVVPDLHFRSLRETVRDELYIVGEQPGGVVSIRFRTGDVPGFLAAVDGLWQARMPGVPIERMFLDEALAALYAREDRQASLLGVFAGVAILLSCLGLLAMTAFAAQRRTKEIAVRKVLGANTIDVVRLLLWQFSKPVLVANLVAWPVAWLVLRRWLDGFAYRIDVPPAAFAGAGLAALAVALATVALHAWKVANTSPARALRHD